MKKENRYVFPAEALNEGMRGIRLRDYFAAKAMQQLLSEIDSERVIKEHEDSMLRQVTKASYKVADVMLTERENYEEK